jgi:hypothetical protein
MCSNAAALSIGSTDGLNYQHLMHHNAAAASAAAIAKLQLTALQCCSYV